MNTASDQPQHTPPIQIAGDPPPGKTGSGIPSALTMERIQGYLAPLERLGNQKIAWIGSFLLFIGVFLPVKAASIPFFNVTVSASLWDFAKLESLLLIVLAVTSAALAYIQDYKWLWATGAVALFFLVIEFFNSLTQSYVHPSWGWLVLFPGVTLIIAAAVMKYDSGEPHMDAISVIKNVRRHMSTERRP